MPNDTFSSLFENPTSFNFGGFPGDDPLSFGMDFSSSVLNPLPTGGMTEAERLQKEQEEKKKNNRNRFADVLPFIAAVLTAKNSDQIQRALQSYTSTIETQKSRKSAQEESAKGRDFQKEILDTQHSFQASESDKSRIANREDASTRFGREVNLLERKADIDATSAEKSFENQLKYLDKSTSLTMLRDKVLAGLQLEHVYGPEAEAFRDSQAANSLAKEFISSGMPPQYSGSIAKATLAGDFSGVNSDEDAKLALTAWNLMNEQRTDMEFNKQRINLMLMLDSRTKPNFIPDPENPDRYLTNPDGTPRINPNQPTRNVPQLETVADLYPNSSEEEQRDILLGWMGADTAKAIEPPPSKVLADEVPDEVVNSVTNTIDKYLNDPDYNDAARIRALKGAAQNIYLTSGRSYQASLEVINKMVNEKGYNEKVVQYLVESLNEMDQIEKEKKAAEGFNSNQLNVPYGGLADLFGGSNSSMFK